MSSEQSVESADAASTTAAAAAAPADAPEVVDAGVDASAEVAALRAQLAEVERKNEYLAAAAVKATKPHWVAEHQRKNPELTLLLGKEAFQSIEATSRREYERKVEELRATHAPTIGRLQALRDEATARVEAVREQTVQAARAEVQAAWGKPAADLVSAHVPDVKDKQADTLQKLVNG